MRIKHLLGVFIALSIGLTAGAVPAKPGPFPYTQPDGSVVTLERHGDEFLSWTTLYGTGQIVELAPDGYWRPSQISPARREAARQRRLAVNEQRSSLRRSQSRSNISMTQGSRHILVILVEFPDTPFSVGAPADSFNALLNQHGYSDNGATGSVQDYFQDNSHGQFQPIFDVFGPVMLPHEMAYYGAPVRDPSTQKVIQDDKQAELALYDACRLLDEQVDFSAYDADGDGYVDMTLFYYAGYNEAEGASPNTIWPHQWTVQASSSSEARNTRFDGKRLANYFCTSELKGYKGTDMCGIGPTAHEFSHSLGLPDFYDTNYDEDGYCSGMDIFSLMASGCYLNDSRTPPYLNAEERIMLDWMAEEQMPVLPNADISLPSVRDNIAFKSLTVTDGEYFVYECRDGSGWDAYLPQGLAVYHVDKSTVRNVGGNTPFNLWYNWRQTNAINAYGDHPCFYVVPAAAQDNLLFQGSGSQWVFPGSKNIGTYAPRDWEGDLTGTTLSDIRFADGKSSFTAYTDHSRYLRGHVYDINGKALPGALVVVTQVQDPAGAPVRIPLRIPRRSQHLSAYTDQEGSFEILLEGFEFASCHVTASLEGFVTGGADVPLSRRGGTVDLTLSRIGQTDFRYYDENAEMYFYGDGKSKSLMGAIRIPADQLPAEGGEVVSVSFVPFWPASAYYIVVDSGEERILTYKLPDIPERELMKTELRSVDLSGVVNYFPPGKDLYIGYAVQNAQISYSNYEGYLVVIAPGTPNLYMSAFDLNGSNWRSYDDESYALVLKATIVAGKDKPVSFAQMGIPAIADPGKGRYAAGDAFQLQMQLPEGLSVSSTEWFFDGKETGAKSVSLPAGSHTISAVLHYADGSTESFDLVIMVN